MLKKGLLFITTIVLALFVTGCVSTQQNLNNKRISIIEDKLEILHIANSFTLSFDSYKPKEYSSYYSNNGVFMVKDASGKTLVNLSKEKGEIVKFFTPRMQKFIDNNQQRRHIFTNFSITKLDGKYAQLRFNALLTTTDKNVYKTVTAMTYDCKLIKVHGTWKFLEVISNLDKTLDVKLK